MDEFKLSCGVVTIKPATGQVRNELRKVETKYKNLETIKTADFAQRLTALNGGQAIDLKDVAAGKASISTEDAKKIKEQVELVSLYTEEIGALRDQRTLETCRCVIDTAAIEDAKAKKLVLSEASGDFWQSQDLAEVARIIKSFRDQFSG